MANEVTKQLKTRISLKIGDYAYWTTGAGKDIELIKGEVCVCTVAATDNQATTAPTVLFKVCDTTGKKFADLKWASALAADVYDWAKATDTDHKAWLKTNHADLDTRYAFSTEGDKLVVKKTLYTNGVAGTEEEVGTYEFLSETEVRNILANYYTKEEVNGLIAGVVGDKDKDTKDSNTIIGAKKYVDDAIEGIVSGSGYATQTWVTGEIEKLDKPDAAVAGQYVSAVSEKDGIITVTRENLPTSADYGVLSVSNGDNAIVVGGTAQRPSIGIVTSNTGNVKLSTVGGLSANIDLSEYRKIADDENTAHTHANGSGTKVTAAGGTDGEVKVNLNVAFELVDKTIKLYDKDDTNKTALATLDATEFIADGMLASVTADQTNNKLVFEWNTDAGVTKTEIALSSIADIYTGSNGDEVNVAVSNTNVVSASLNSAVATKISHGEDAYNWGDHSKAGYALEEDLGPLATIQPVNNVYNINTSNALSAITANSANNAAQLGGQMPAYYATAQSVTDITKDGGTIDAKITAFDNTLGDLAKKDKVTASDLDGKIDHTQVDGLGALATAVPNEYGAYQMTATNANHATSAGQASSLLHALTNTTITADKVLTEIHTGTGLKVTTGTERKNVVDGSVVTAQQNKVEIDTDVVFILDCNW